MLKEFRADLHIHTCLSPCAELDMTPSAVVKESIKKNLDIIAITDHNSAENIIEANKITLQPDITVLAGMEVTSSEEAHIIALFGDIQSVTELQDIVYSNLPGTEDDNSITLSFTKDGPGGFGEQVIVNEKDEVLGFSSRFLISATELPAQSIVDIIHSLGGLAIASHIDKDVFSIISQLGFIPENLSLDALEMSPNISREQAKLEFGFCSSYTWVSSSDAHYINSIGNRTTVFHIHEPTIQEISLAMQNIDGRKVEWK
jgi:PHP family Zn ribbon phosphoesterase